MSGKKMQALWQDYRFLTKEMMKFLTKQDMDLFYNLMGQREQLQIIINNNVDDDFNQSPEGQRLIAEIQQDSQEIIDSLQLLLSRDKRNQQISKAYNCVSTTAVSRMNWNR